MNQPLAYVHPGAKIAKNVVIEPFTTIHNNVVIGEGTWIGSNVTIMEGARIGKNCNIFPGAVISAIPQDLKFNDEDTTAGNWRWYYDKRICYHQPWYCGSRKDRHWEELLDHGVLSYRA